ncbi:MAG: hypothetical protein A2289_16640 [Deltaproteobacteria bacterium RIFOXYA12_FULL_58_15]|nr:MAG: hypothetical protein A2289_16640 [Deltaproteobacteria bacterium RIFOXYA12_FULL_58_15]
MKSGSNLLFVAGVILVLALVVVGYFFILGPTASAPIAEPTVAAGTVGGVGQVRLARAEGAVEIRLGTGEWLAAHAGANVGPDTEVRTGVGTAALSYGDDLDIELSVDSEVRLTKLENDLARFEVQQGHVIADVKPGSGKVVQLGAAHSDAVAETRDGRLHLLTDGEGSVQAAVTRGRASVSSEGTTVEIPAGYQTAILPGKAPQTPMALPGSLLLKIKWPATKSTKKRRQLVVGNTNPFLRVRIGDSVVTADEAGRFRAIVELAEGQNQISARVVDVVGRVESSTSPPIVLDTKPPKHAITTDPDMWKRKSP